MRRQTTVVIEMRRVLGQARSSFLSSITRVFLREKHVPFFTKKYMLVPALPASVNEYQLWLGRQRQVWFIPLADVHGVCR